uniref:Uncharacterized protein n=1 Tax=Anguilla anguilla TaxID=7936 RepID=A0A0E9RWW5_ANGAN
MWLVCFPLLSATNDGRFKVIEETSHLCCQIYLKETFVYINRFSIPYEAMLL